MRRSQGTVIAEDHFEQAAQWHARWRHAPSSGLALDELGAWTRWIKDPNNKAAFDAVEFAAQSRRLLQTPPMPTPGELAADDFDGSSSLAEWNERSRSRAPVGQRRTAVLFATAAGIVAVGLFLLPRVWHLGSTTLDRGELLQTTAGEKRQVTLQDGSQVTLGDTTRVSVHYGQCRRVITLESGEALFSVAHSRTCPFVVIAGDGAVTALGTRFSVRRALDRVTVSVADGIVDVQPRETLTSIPMPKEADIPKVHWARARLVAGQEVSYAGKGARGPIESEDPYVATAWVEGRREYRHEPLAYVVADINRRFRKQILLGDPAVGELQFTGRVYEMQVADWLQALERIFPVTVSQSDSNQITIRSRTTAEVTPRAD